MPVISVKNLTKHYSVAKKMPGLSGSLKSLFSREYETVKAVNDISFEIEEGELIGFIGPNGAGKTTTLKSLSGLLYPTSGNVTVMGFKPYQRKTRFLKHISLVMGQKQQLWWDLPPIETFNLNKEIYGIPDGIYKSTLNELVELLDVKEVLNIQSRKLSLGQRMKCELIAALLHAPHVLFLDEPTIGLDVVMQKTIREFIKEYNQRFNATILLTSHYMKDVQELCKRVIIIDHGTILFDGKLDEIIKKFADHKIFIVTFESAPKASALKKYGEIIEANGNQISLSVKREHVASTASVLLKHHNIQDLNIEETSIEDIIRNVFNNR